jgi:hypothetical protein
LYHESSRKGRRIGVSACRRDYFAGDAYFDKPRGPLPDDLFQIKTPLRRYADTPIRLGYLLNFGEDRLKTGIKRLAFFWRHAMPSFLN